MFCDFSTKAGPRRTATKRTFLPASAPRTRKKAGDLHRPGSSHAFAAFLSRAGRHEKSPPPPKKQGVGLPQA